MSGLINTDKNKKELSPLSPATKLTPLLQNNSQSLTGKTMLF